MFHVTNRTRSHTWVTTCAVLVLLSWPVPAATPRAKPEEVGLSSERLHRIGETIQRNIQAGR